MQSTTIRGDVAHLDGGENSLSQVVHLARLVLVPFFFAAVIAHGLVLDLWTWNNPFSRYERYRDRRGMSFVPDLFDWLGGYPFEVATSDQIFDFYRESGFTLVTLKTCGGGRGNNQYVFVRSASLPSPLLHIRKSLISEETNVVYEPLR